MRKNRAYIAGILLLFFCAVIVVPGYDDEKPRIVGIGIACSNDRVYTWYSDQTVSVGTTENLSAHEPPHRFNLPFGKTPADIVEIGIASTDKVFTWYKDLTLSVGTSTDLDKYEPRHPYRLPKFTSVESLVGIDIACSNDHVYVWNRNGQVSSGTSEDLDKYSDKPRPFTTGGGKTPVQLIGMGIARNDHVYAWYLGGTASSGTSTSLSQYRKPYDFVTGPGPCSVFADAPQITSRTLYGREERFVSGVAIRGPECKSTGSIVVRLKTVETFPKTLAERTQRGSNFESPLSFPCKGTAKKTVFTEVESAGRIVKSPNSTLECF